MYIVYILHTRCNSYSRRRNAKRFDHLDQFDYDLFSFFYKPNWQFLRSVMIFKYVDETVSRNFRLIRKRKIKFANFDSTEFFTIGSEFY